MRVARTRGWRRVSPLLAAGLLVMWLLLNQSLAPGQVAIGLVLAVALAGWSATLRPLRATLRRVHLVAGLLPCVLVDVLRSNLNVARIVLGLVGGRRIRSGFVAIPLDLRDPHGHAALAAIVTCTPGTVWVDLAPDTNVLTLHVLDLRDEAEWVNIIKGRYEPSLRGIFE